MRSVALFDFDNTLYDGFSYFDLLQKQTDEGVIAPDVLSAAKETMGQYKSGVPRQLVNLSKDIVPRAKPWIKTGKTRN